MGKKLFCWTAMALVLASVWAGSARAELVAWWKLDDGAGTTAVDSSENGHDGTLNGDPAWIEGVYGGALQLDGSDDHVMCGLIDIDTTVTGGVTVTAWINKPAGGDYKVCSNRQAENAAGGGFTCSIYNDHMEMDVTSDAARNLNRDSDGDTVPADTWVHLAWVLNDAGDTFNEYYNGVLVDSSAESVSVTVSTAEFRIGGDSPTLGHYFSGMIDDLRIYDHVLTESELADVMAGKGPNAEFATAPSPAADSIDVPRDTTLSWTAGEYAASHDVYLGASLADVEMAGRDNPMDLLVSQGQAGTSYTPPAVLEYGQTYYWRVDEVNAAPDNTIFKGEVWSFTVEPLAYPIGTVVATSNGAAGVGPGPEKTVDGSGLNEDDEHGVAADDMWLTTAPAGEDLYIEYAFDAVYKLHEMLVWNYNIQFELVLGFGLKDVAVEYSENGTDWMTLGDVQFAQGLAATGYTPNTVIDFGGVAAQYVRLTVNSGYGMMGQYGLSEVRFLYIPINAREPEPADGAADVSVDSALAWRAGREAVSHEVALGTDAAALALVGTVDITGYTPDDLQLATTYYWQVTEVNDAATPSTWAGSVWSFATQEFVVVDDFESYNDEDNVIYESWIDGWVNETGSTVGYLEAPFAEQDMIHGGSQSMPLFYDNAGNVSEADLSLAGQDWTRAGITTLTLYFRGEADNSGGQLYVKINGVKVAYPGGADMLSKLLWQQWNIDLASVGTTLGNVTGLTIGIEGNGAGKIYVDDIRLYSEAPAIATPTDPGTDGILLQYTFDADASDSSGNGYDGTLLGDARVQNGVLSLDGIRDAVSVPRIGGAEATFNEFTVSMWVYPTADMTSLDFSGGMNTDVWAAGAVHFKFHYGLLNVGINGLDGGDLEGASLGVTDVWNHIAVTVSQTEIALYLNGGLEDSRTLAAPIDVILGASSLGAWNNADALSREMTGEMDNVIVYDRALSAGEILFLSDR